MITALLVISLGVSTLLIDIIGMQDGSNFTLNLVGVCIAVCLVVAVLYRIRDLPFMTEVVYVWRLKHELNVIYRQSAKLKPAAELNNYNALIVTHYSLKASIQLYELDDNDLTLTSLRADLMALESKMHTLGIVVSTAEYHRDLLNQLTDTHT